MAKTISTALATALFLAAWTHVRGADEVAVETLLRGLTSPCGVAVRPGESPERYEIFVADSGAGRIVRVTSDAPTSSVETVSGFPLTELGEGGLPVGPLGLLFLDRRRLVVGVSGEDAASVQLFELTDAAAPLQAGAAKQQARFPGKRGIPGHIYAISRRRANETVRDALVVTYFNNDQTGELRTIAVRADSLAEPATLVAADGGNSNSPAAITIADGGYVVVGWVGSLEEPRDSRLTFYNPTDGTQLMDLSSGLYDILGLAYSPRSGNLYAADAAWMDPHQGGVFRIDAVSETPAAKCNAVKIADVVRPTALAFGPDGALYVTAFGELEKVDSPGVLLKITGDL
jgi:hypothetical protein